MEWKILKENNLYEINEIGVIRYVDTKLTLGGTIYRKRRVVMLRLGDSTRKHRYELDRLVAEHFCENSNPEKKTAVYHKDGNQMNCRADNLVWMTRREKSYYEYKKVQDAKEERRKQNQMPVPVDQFDMEGNFIAAYPSMAEAHRTTGLRVVDIRNATYGKIEEAGGFIWKIGSTATEEQLQILQSRMYKKKNKKSQAAAPQPKQKVPRLSTSISTSQQ